MTHTITWDHVNCEHSSDPDEHWCSPWGLVICNDPTGDCRKHCRAAGYTSWCEDGWIRCVNECTGYDHPDPGVEHCTNGHILDLAECNAVLFIDEDPTSNGPDLEPVHGRADRGRVDR